MARTRRCAGKQSLRIDGFGLACFPHIVPFGKGHPALFDYGNRHTRNIPLLADGFDVPVKWLNPLWARPFLGESRKNGEESGQGDEWIHGSAMEGVDRLPVAGW